MKTVYKFFIWNDNFCVFYFNDIEKINAIFTVTTLFYSYSSSKKQLNLLPKLTWNQQFPSLYIDIYIFFFFLYRW